MTKPVRVRIATPLGDPVPTSTDPAEWFRVCTAEEAARKAGEITDEQYWDRVHARDAAIAKLPAKQRIAINSYTS